MAEEWIVKYQAFFEITEWDEVLSDDIDTSIQSISECISYSTELSSTAKDVLVNNSNQPWLSKPIRDDIRKLHRAKKLSSKAEHKLIQKRHNKFPQNTQS